MAKSKKKNQKVSIVITKDALITILVIVLIAAIALAVIYFAFPDTWDALVVLVVGPDKQTNPGTSINAGDLNIFFLDVGQGDSILTVLPDGKTILIDGGNRGNSIASTVTDALDSLAIDYLDYVILTHTDSDHCGSLDVVLNHVESTENIYLPKINTKNNLLNLDKNYLTIDTIEYDDCVKAAQDSTYIDENGDIKKTNIKYLEDRIIISDEKMVDGKPTYSYKMAMFCRNDAYYKSMKDNAKYLNDVSPICVLDCNDRLTLFTGDANNETYAPETSAEINFIDEMKALGYQDSDTNDDFDADILKVGHHGGAGSTGDAFLDYIDCEYAVVSSGGDVHFDEGEDLNKSKGKYDLFINREFDDLNAHPIDFQGNTIYDHPGGDLCKDGGRLDLHGYEACYYTVLHGTVHCTVNTASQISFKTDKVAVRTGETITFQAA